MSGMVRLSSEKLKTRCEPVGEHEISSLGGFIDGMLEIADGKTCIGLAANQVGLDSRIIVINCKGFKQEIINPVVERTFGGVSAQEEGCMSFPGRKVRVIRPKRCRVSGLNRQGEAVAFSPKDPLICRALLHEVDHLNGMTMMDRAKNPNAGYSADDVREAA